MDARRLGWIIAAMLLAANCAAHGQSAKEPSATLPSGPAPAPLVLPKSSGPITLYATKPQDVPPPAPLPEEEDSFCTTPSDATYRTSKPQTAETKRASDLYTRTVVQQIRQSWKPPREANDPWLKGAQVRLRFEILPDGRLNDPVIMMSSGRASYDRRALESVKNAAPFAAPPPAALPLKICFHFLYNMEAKPRDALPADVFAPKAEKP